ncbi:hypothetical protein Trihar35433_7665 [Trichoderma harzianum]|nr:hypothetical protein Trihar35433_7665 [Trichoderma harzianum]
MRSLALLIILAARANALCYYPDGTPAPGDVPCTDSTDNSVCCGTGYACLSNGICQATGDELQKPGASEFVRGSCTDKTFRSSSCPSFCGTPDVDNVGGGEGMEKCTNTKQDVYWCVNQQNIDLSQNEDICSDQNAVVFFPGTPTALTTIGVAQKSTSSTSSTAAPPTTMSTSTTPSSSPTNTGTGAGTGTGTSTPTSSSTSPPAETTPASSGSKSNGGVIGGAVGGSLGGAAAIGILAFFFLRRRRGRRDTGIHEMDYTPVEPKTSATPLVHHPSTPHSPDDVLPVHEVPGSTEFESVKKHTPDEPMELPA